MLQKISQSSELSAFINSHFPKQENTVQVMFSKECVSISQKTQGVCITISKDTVLNVIITKV